MSEPAPVPKPRLLLAEVMPPLPAPDLGRDHRALGMRVRAHRAGEVLGLRQRRQVHLLAQVRELVLELVELLLRLLVRQLLAVHRRRLTGIFFSGSIFGFSSTFGGGGGGGGFGFSSIMTRARRCGTAVSAAVRFGVGSSGNENAEDHEDDEQHPQDLAEARARLGIAFPGQLVLTVKGREQHHARLR